MLNLAEYIDKAQPKQASVFCSSKDLIMATGNGVYYECYSNFAVHRACDIYYVN